MPGFEFQIHGQTHSSVKLHVEIFISVQIAKFLSQGRVNLAYQMKMSDTLVKSICRPIERYGSK